MVDEIVSIIAILIIAFFWISQAYDIRFRAIDLRINPIKLDEKPVFILLKHPIFFFLMLDQVFTPPLESAQPKNRPPQNGL